MKKWLKKLFCKHEYDLKDATKLGPIEFEDADNGTYVRGSATVGVCCHCIKCNKINKRLTKAFSKIKANQVKYQLDNTIRERAGKIYVRKIGKIEGE